MILLYWWALSAPERRIAAALAIEPRAVEGRMAGLRDRLGIGSGAITLDLDNGSGPRSDQRWPDRHAQTIVRTGLARSRERPLVHVVGEGVLTVGETARLVSQICAGLRRNGVGPGRRVAVDASQRLESFLVALACLIAGVVVVRLGDGLGPSILSGMVRQVPVDMTFSARLNQIGDRPETGTGIDLSSDGVGGVVTFAEWLGTVEFGDGTFPPVSVTPDCVALIGFSSGSTGAPKPILTSHEAVFRTTEAAARRFALREDDVFCTATDFTALSAFRSMITLPLFCGGSIVLPSEEARRQPLALAMECADFGVTRLTAVPNVLRGVARAGPRLKPGSFERLRTAFVGSGVLDQATADAFRQMTGAAVVDYYGAREIGTVAYTDGSAGDTMSAGGGLVSEAMIRVEDAQGCPARHGETGEISVHTDCIMLEDDAGRAATPGAVGGWFRTGDLGRWQSDGRLEIVGRLRDIVKTHDGGLVAPIEVEDALHQSDAISEACVFGWRDQDAIERLAAVVVPAPDQTHVSPRQMERQLQKLVGDQLGAYRIPARILVWTDLPRVGRGKIDRRSVRRAFEAEMAADGASRRSPPR